MVKKIFLRPKIVYIYKRKIGYGLLLRTYLAYSMWQEGIYDQVIAATPRYKGTDERRQPGFVQSHIKLVTAIGEKGIKYKNITVPGGTVKGTPAYHALMAIYSLHEGRQAFTVQGKTMTFPVRKGQVFRNPKVLRQGPGRGRGPRNWMVTKRTTQRKWGAGRNTWISNVFNKNTQMLVKLLHLEYTEASKKPGRKVVIAVG